MNAVGGLVAPTALITVVAVLVAAGSAVLLSRRGVARERVLRAVAAVLLVGAVVAVLHLTLAGSARVATDGSLVPLRSIRAELGNVDPWLGIVNLIGNAAVFVPIGLLVPLAWERPWTRGIASAAVLSAGIELCQWEFRLGAGDVDDLILNTLGGLIGAVGAFSVRRRLCRRRTPQSV